MDVVTFTVIVDDIIYPDGHSALACLGGGGPQTAFGARLWTKGDESVGLAAGVGRDFPSSCREWLQDMEIDISGLVFWPYPTLRAWQILEEGGQRSQVWKVAVGQDVWAMLRPALTVLPSEYQLGYNVCIEWHLSARGLICILDCRKAKVYHVSVHPSARDVDFIKGLKRTGAEVVSAETYTHAEDIVSRSELMALVSAADIFSPNEREAISLVGPGPPLELIGRLVELGAEVVALRRGDLGCVVHRSDTGETWEVPAFHTTFDQGSKRFTSKRSTSSRGTSDTEKVDNTFDSQGQIYNLGVAVKGVLDPTGCGNCFCGGFVVGWWKTRNLLTAALWGSISASFMAEFEGVPPPTLAYWQAQADFRLKVLRPHARELHLK